MFRRDMGIDFGTANTLIYVKGKGILLDEPTMGALDIKKEKLTEIGKKAKEALGEGLGKRYPINPVKRGVIGDVSEAEAVLSGFIKYAFKKRFFELRPKVLLCVPQNITDVEKRALIETVLQSAKGVRDIFLIESAMAAAIGEGADVRASSGTAILEIGAGKSRCAVISLGGSIEESSSKTGGEAFDECIVGHIKAKYGILISKRSAEKIKEEFGCLSLKEKEKEEKYLVKGIDKEKGLPREVMVSKGEISEVLIREAENILDMLKGLFEKVPSDIMSDIKEKGIILTGGGSLLKGMDTFIEEKAKLPVSISEEPMKSVILGCGKVLENIDKMLNLIEKSVQ